MRFAPTVLLVSALCFACVTDFSEPDDDDDGRPGGALPECSQTSNFLALTPNPYDSLGNGSFIASSTRFMAAFRTRVQGADASSFLVRGVQSGPKFRGQTYGGNGTTTVISPVATFLPGEEIEVVLTTTLACPDPWVGRLRVAPTVPATGTFPSFNTYNAGINSAAVAAADLDHDGDLDLAVANGGLPGMSGTVSVLLGDGSGAFPTQQSYFVGVSPSSVAIADLDNDGHLDLAVANAGNDTIMGDVSLLAGNGNGTFREPQTWFAGQNPQSVKLADVNGDGFVDICVANPTDPGTVTLLLGDGTGFFVDVVFYQTAGSTTTSLDIGDVNNDGKLDLVAGNINSNDVSVLLGHGDATYQSPRRFATGDRPGSLALADLDRDGHIDIAAANSGASSISLLIGDGSGAFPTQQSALVGDSVRYVAIADLNADGRLDLAAVTQVPIGVAVLLNSAGGFLTEQTYNTGPRAANAVTIADVNRDGRLDLIVARAGASGTLDNISVLLGQ